MGELISGCTLFTAFSNDGNNVNKRVSSCIPNIGPIPYSQYYKIDFESRGFRLAS
jgi:hypothetical protein